MIRAEVETSVPEVPAVSRTVAARCDRRGGGRRALRRSVGRFAPAARSPRCPTSSRAPARSRWRRPSRACSRTAASCSPKPGTGTGKTLAYLVPAILSRERVLISTGTKNLQEQIFFKDIPALRDALGIPFTATYMKGRANYLCLHRLDQLTDGAGPAVHDVFLPIIREWSDAHRDRRSRGARGSAGGSGVLERGVGDGRDLSRHRVPALRRLLRHADAPARRGVRRRHRQPSPAVRRRGGPAERVRRGDSRVHAARSSTRRTSSRTSRRSTSASASATTASRSSRATSNGSSPPAASSDRQRAGRDREGGRAAARPRARVLHRARVRPPRQRPRAKSEERVRATAESLGQTRDAAAHLTGALDVLEATLALLGRSKPDAPARTARPADDGRRRRGRRDARAARRPAARRAALPPPRRRRRRTCTSSSSAAAAPSCARRRSTSPRSSASCCSIACTRRC